MAHYWEVAVFRVWEKIPVKNQSFCVQCSCFFDEYPSLCA
jgi:hypothetical protein